MCDHELLDLARLLDEHRDRAPVGKLRHRELGKTLEGSVELERRGEQRRRLGKEREPLAQPLLGRGEPSAFEGERSLAPERDLQRAALGGEVLVGREGEDEAADRPALADERDAHEPVSGLRAPDELRIALVSLRLRSDEDALAGAHRLREREVAGDREAAKRLDPLQVVAARGDHLEPLAVVAQRRDQPAAGLGCSHALGQDRVEHFLRRAGSRECVGDTLLTRRRVEGARALPYRPLRPLARRALAPQHLASEQGREDEDGKRGRTLAVDLAAVVAGGEEVEEWIRGCGNCGEAADSASGGRGEDDRDGVEEPRDDRANAGEGEQRDEPRRAEGDHRSARMAHRETRPPARPRVPAWRCVGDQPAPEARGSVGRALPWRSDRARPRTTSASSNGSNGLTT